MRCTYLCYPCFVTLYCISLCMQYQYFTSNRQFYGGWGGVFILFSLFFIGQSSQAQGSTTKQSRKLNVCLWYINRNSTVCRKIFMLGPYDPAWSYCSITSELIKTLLEFLAEVYLDLQKTYLYKNQALVFFLIEIQ